MRRLDARTIHAEGESQPHESPGRVVTTLPLDFDRQSLHGGTPLREDVHDVHAGTRGQGAQQGVGRRLSRLPTAVEPRERAAGTSGVEAVLAHPRGVNATGCAGHRTHRSIGARTALPHSVQLPS